MARRRRRSERTAIARRRRRGTALATAERLADAVLSYAERKPVEFAELVRGALDGRLKRALVHAMRDPEVRDEVVARAVRAAATAARRSL